MIQYRKYLDLICLLFIVVAAGVATAVHLYLYNQELDGPADRIEYRAFTRMPTDPGVNSVPGKPSRLNVLGAAGDVVASASNAEPNPVRQDVEQRAATQPVLN